MTYSLAHDSRRLPATNHRVSQLRALKFALAVFLIAGSAAAEPVSFKGKTVTMIIGFAAGGGTDLSGRLIASFLGKYLPGEPTVIAIGSDAVPWAPSDVVSRAV